MAEKKEYKNALRPGYELVGGDHAYTIEQVLGQGGFGITYRVTAKIKTGNITVKTRFAVKEFFPSDCWRDPGSAVMKFSPNHEDEIKESLSDFINEGKRLQKICQKNSNIVNVNEVFEDKATGTAYFVMEYLAGGDLCSMVKSYGGGVSEATMMSILNPIANAVQFLHENNMLHLDIKPDNIVMRQSDDPNEADIPVLIDFGISVHFKKDGSPTTKNPNKGTSQGYSPTEQYAGVTHFAPQYDIYALAATCFYMLAGCDPKSAFEVTSNDIRNELEGKASERTIDAIVHGMRKDASDRPKTIGQFLKGFKESNAMRIGHIVKGRYQNYLVVAVIEEKEDFILYKATTASATGADRSTHATMKTSYNLWEQFSPSLGDKRSKNGQVILASQTRPGWLIPNQVARFESHQYGFKGGTNGGALDCEYFVNGTQYVAVREKYKPRPQWIVSLEKSWRKLLQALGSNKKGILIGAAAVATLAVGYWGYTWGYLSWQESQRQKHEQLSDQLQAAIDNNDKAELERFADMDSARAFLPLAYIYESEGNYDLAREFAQKAMEYGGLDVASAENLVQRIDEVLTYQADSIRHAEEEAAQMNEPSESAVETTTETQSTEKVKTDLTKEEAAKKAKEEAAAKAKREAEAKKKKEEAERKAKEEAAKKKKEEEAKSKVNLDEQARQAYARGDEATLKRLARQGNSTAKSFCESAGIKY